MIHKIPAADLFEKRLDLVFKYLDESFTFGSDNEGIEELVEEKFVKFWNFHIKYSEIPDDEEIKEFAIDLEKELYEMESLAELRAADYFEDEADYL